MWNWSENQIKLILIRHGATAANKEHRYLGKIDEALSEEGIKEMQNAKCLNLYPNIEYLFSSPMKRCLETARILYPAREPIIIQDWEEMDFGVFEGKNYMDLQGDVRYQTWIDSNGTLPFPEGECREDFIVRCEKGLHRMLKILNQLHCKERGCTTTTIGSIVHGGTIMSLLSSFYGGEYFDYQVTNSDGYICTLKGSMEKPEIIKIEKIKGE